MVQKEKTAIVGVTQIMFNPHCDQRGALTELFRTDWMDTSSHNAAQQVNLSTSRAHVLRGLHFHYHQADFWIPIEGEVVAGLADLRRGSPTEGVSTCIRLSAQHRSGLYIPPGVAHGYYAVQDMALLYLVDRLYTGKDEQGVAWDDENLAVDWNLKERPILSTRDENNPSYKDLLADALPGYT
jgi:dTDP-4-dehydrorhamnose 3,5-epimerase